MHSLCGMLKGSFKIVHNHPYTPAAISAVLVKQVQCILFLPCSNLLSRTPSKKATGSIVKSSGIS